MNEPIEAKLVATDLNDDCRRPGAGATTRRTPGARSSAPGARSATVRAQQGRRGFPNLLDDDWLWGGAIEDIHTTVTHGIRNTTDPDARYSQMPAFGDILEEADIDAVVNHVLAISGQDHDAELAAKGSQVFADNCVSCHMEGGNGDRAQGAPNLTDAIWL